MAIFVYNTFYLYYDTKYSNPNKQTISFDIPKDYIGKEIEVIAFAKDEELAKESTVRKEVSFSALAIDTRGYKFNREEANER